jgi:hypothetical protein
MIRAWNRRSGHRWLLLLVVVGLTASSCFPRNPGADLRHFEMLAPRIGEQAPDLTLYTLEGERVRLADHFSDRPVVLQFASLSCPVFRLLRWQTEDLQERYGDRVVLLRIYTLEAHPVDALCPYREEEWDIFFNRIAGVRLPQTVTLEQRLGHARAMQEELDLSWEVLVDGMENRAWARYGAASTPAFVLDRNGRVVSRMAWTQVDEIAALLDQILSG